MSGRVLLATAGLAVALSTFSVSGARAAERYQPGKVKDQRSLMVFRPADRKAFKTFYPLLRDRENRIYHADKTPRTPQRPKRTPKAPPITLARHR